MRTPSVTTCCQNEVSAGEGGAATASKHSSELREEGGPNEMLTCFLFTCFLLFFPSLSLSSFFFPVSGCVKGKDCSFQHPTAPNGAVTNRICDYFGSARGCLKGETCPFLHPIRYNPQGEPATRVCDFYLTSQGE